LGAAGLADKDGFGFFRYHSNTLLGRKVSETRSNAWKSDDVRTGKTEKNRHSLLITYLFNFLSSISVARLIFLIKQK
jgi:hypothetical protein